MKPDGQRVRGCVRGVLGALGLGAALALPSTALAGPGPDVIVGDLPDTTSYGLSSSFFVYDIGTESCNVGTQNLLWEEWNSNHPVIGQNIYRISSGRIEQIGMSWLKHGFFALTGNLCQRGCSGVGGSVLGVGCSDPYTFGLNGTQEGLGPRYEVNPFSGVFPYPPANPAYTGIHPRRIQVATVDIDPAQYPDAVYVGEAQYIAADDAQAGNGWNNASWRYIRFANNFNRESSWVPGSTTRRTQPAIYAWRDVDPQVSVFPVDVPGDGQVYVGQRVTALPGGGWRYVIAVQNLNCERAIRSISVPKSAGAGALTNPGSSFIRYHSGETTSNVGWNSSIVSGGAIFGCDPYSADPNGPAIRWGTLRSVWFDSDVAPMPGSIALELFKPGSAGQAQRVAVSVLTPGGASSVPEVFGDQCATARVLHPGPNGLSTLGATSAGPDACSELGSSQILADVWGTYTFADACSGTMTISTCGSDFDTKIAVYAGSACPTAPGTPIACNDDGGACAGPGASSVSFAASAGATYLIRVGSRSGATGHAVLTITPPDCAPPPGACCVGGGACALLSSALQCSTQGGTWLGQMVLCAPNPCPQPPPPANDNCADAFTVGDSLAGAPLVSGSNVYSTNDPAPAPPTCESGSRDVWYIYTPARSESVTVDTCSTVATGLADTVLQVISSCSGTQIACNDDEPSCATRSRVTFAGTAGTAYLIRVMGFAAATGEFTLRVAGGGGIVGGACCRGSTCAVTARQACISTGGRFVAGSACNIAGNTAMPCCKADYNQSGAISVQDVFDFLSGFFAGDPRADITGNGAGVPTVQSVFDFLAAFFAGGC